MHYLNFTTPNNLLKIFLLLFLILAQGCFKSELLKTLLNSTPSVMKLQSGTVELIRKQDSGTGLLGKPVKASVSWHIIPRKSHSLEQVIEEVSLILTNNGWQRREASDGKFIGMTKNEGAYKLYINWLIKRQDGYIFMLVGES